MKLRSKLATLVAAGVTAVITIGLGPAAPAQAAGTCSLIVPSKIRIAQPYQAVTARLSSNCSQANTEAAAWDLYHPTEGFNDILIFDGTSTATWDVYDDWVTPARYTWRPAGAFDPNYDEVAQNQPTTDVRVGSSAAIYTSRSGSYVTITTSSARYAYSLSKWVRWGGVRGTIQYWGTNGWTNMKYAYQNSNGYYTYRFYAPKGRSYRVVFPDSSGIWGSTSATSWR